MLVAELVESRESQLAPRNTAAVGLGTVSALTEVTDAVHFILFFNNERCTKEQSQ